MKVIGLCVRDEVGNIRTLDWAFPSFKTYVERLPDLFGEDCENLEDEGFFPHECVLLTREDYERLVRDAHNMKK